MPQGIAILCIACIGLCVIGIIRSHKRRSLVHLLSYLYLALTALVVAYLSLFFIFSGSLSLSSVLVPGPLSDLGITVLYVSISWLLIGLLLTQIAAKRIGMHNIIEVIGFYLIAFIYLNILRERTGYLDVHDYIKAAQNILMGEPLHRRYIYPPFWAVCITPFAPSGESVTRLILMAANYVSLLFFYILLHKALQKYGLLRNTAAVVVFVALCVNVPILRNMMSVQVNIHVANLVLLSLLYSTRNQLLSALALSLAVHLKISPIVFVLVFLLTRQWKWLAWFVLFTAAIAWGTAMVAGWHSYSESLMNIRALYALQHVTIREFSFDSLVRVISRLLGGGDQWAVPIIAGIKLMFLTLTLWMFATCVKRSVYHDGQLNEAIICNGFVVLSLLQLILAPFILEYHPVFIIFAYVVVFTRLSGWTELALWLIGYYVLYLLPVFDFFPISFVRLWGIVLCYVIIWMHTRRDSNTVGWFLQGGICALGSARVAGKNPDSEIQG